VRESDADVTLFKSVGIAFEDLVIARAAVDRR
jgi:ornithine cyclodeaminase/alanine dehydrogenase-like protein (mu-crystallin family)